MENLIKSIEKELKELNEKIEDLSDYIKVNENEEGPLLQMQMFQMLQYKDALNQRLNKLK